MYMYWLPVKFSVISTVRFWHAIKMPHHDIYIVGVESLDGGECPDMMHGVTGTGIL